MRKEYMSASYHAEVDPRIRTRCAVIKLRRLYRQTPQFARYLKAVDEIRDAVVTNETVEYLTDELGVDAADAHKHPMYKDAAILCYKNETAGYYNGLELRHSYERTGEPIVISHSTRHTSVHAERATAQLFKPKFIRRNLAFTYNSKVRNTIFYT